ncbi:MAG TPA: DNA translocase FtsK [Gemmatimonadales bacterium]|jgi:S-DNA-T family DNA segregation ATPase FtsK/SpoIIIE|nr:DNA translocase FtsK [Gemmatimonadales bacterium]
MTTENGRPAGGVQRRRFGAVTALVIGLFVGLTLLPLSVTGPIGHALGATLWRVLGAGALGIPVLGIALALAGFERLGTLDMKRAAFLIVGLSVLLPYLVGVLLHVSVRDLDNQRLLGRMVGVVPGFFAVEIPMGVGTAGAVLVGFLALTALTLATFAWHPLQPLERKPESPFTPGTTGSNAEGRARKAPASAAKGEEDPPALPRADGPVKPAAARGDGKTGRLKPGKRPDPRRAPGQKELGPVWDVELLEAPRAKAVDAGEAELDVLQERLESTLAEFKVEGDVAGRTTGPVVTQYGVRLRAGVKMNRLVTLADDLALKMSARSIRVARIPGRDMVGVEVPNPKSRVVLLRELLEDEQWSGEERLLPVALGLDLEGRPVIADLAKMPHLLIAGATGTGKSVGINAIITSLIYHYQHKEDLRLLMIDPKMVELSMYKDLPHLRHPVVTNNKEAARVLKWAVGEMERRYVLLEANGARNLSDFNRKVLEGKPLRNPVPRRVTLTDIVAEPPDTPPPAPVGDTYTEGKLPLIVVVVDELADLMMTVQTEVETPLARLAQKARAVGLHLILATQRPSVNVITGLIKANFPSRIAFRVASKVDSRTILDQNGSEALLGKGDMLFLEPGKSDPMRLQGAYISTEESERIMERYRQWREERDHRGMAELAESNILDEVPEAEGEGGDEATDPGERDPQFKDAAIACVQNQGGSTSLLQRKLGIGYGRAARIMDQLEEAGILGPANGSKPRDVRIGIEQIDEYCR